MGFEAIKLFRFVLDETDRLYSDVHLEFYRLLDLDEKELSIYESEDFRTKEEIKASIEKFSFNLQEFKFLAQVREIIEEEMKKLETSGNYDLMKDSLLERLKKLRNIDIYLEDDFRELSTRVANAFVSKEILYNYFISRQEKIINMIKSYNQNIIDSLIAFTPQLIDELKSEMKKENTTMQSQQEQNISANLGKDIVSKERIINDCKIRYNELQRKLSFLENGYYGSGSKIQFTCGKLRYVISQLEDFIKKLSAGKSIQNLINKYSKETDFNKMMNLILSEAIPQLTEVNRLTIEVDYIYEKKSKSDYNQYELPIVNLEGLHNKIITSTSVKDLLVGKKMIEQCPSTLDYDTKQRLKEEYDILMDKIITLSMINEKKRNSGYSSNGSVNNGIKESKYDVRYLVNSNKFYGILRSIKITDSEKYKDFIMTGFNYVMDRWSQQAKLCNTFMEKEAAYQEFYELYEVFKDYLPAVIVNMLKQVLEEMEKNIYQEKEKNTELDEVRYTGPHH